MQSVDVETVLNDDIKFRGKLEFTNNLQINGRFQGKINTTGHLIIGPSADVTADIEAAVVTIEGRLKGNVIARQKIHVRETAVVRGDFRAPDLSIESGSRFSGNCIMD
ncbi:MAG: polymer-forming cytoskeletal protein [Spirochaetales bacterium]|nr:polymer-forming cytoskeletal protein [Spirochaetales bacterium]